MKKTPQTFGRAVAPNSLDPLLVAVMVFSSPKCTSCVFGSVIVTSFKRSLKYSLHLPRLSFSFLSKTPFWSLIDLAV